MAFAKYTKIYSDDDIAEGNVFNEKLFEGNQPHEREIDEFRKGFD